MKGSELKLSILRTGFCERNIEISIVRILIRMLIL